MKEIRFEVQIISDTEFLKLPRHKTFSRTDWYMSDHRIRKMEIESGTVWYKIMSNQAMQATKKKVIIQRPNLKDLEKFCIIKLVMDSVRPVIDDTELYMEKVTASNKDKTVIFYSSEAEDAQGLKVMPLLKKVKCVKSIKKIGEKSLQSIALSKLK